MNTQLNGSQDEYTAYLVEANTIESQRSHYIAILSLLFFDLYTLHHSENIHNLSIEKVKKKMLNLNRQTLFWRRFAIVGKINWHKESG